jgi:hypothetical protein
MSLDFDSVTPSVPKWEADWNAAELGNICSRQRVKVELNRKTKPRYLGPMVILPRTIGGSYLLTELDGSVSRLRYAAFRLLPYQPRSRTRTPVTTVTSLQDEELDCLAEEDEERQPDEEDSDNHAS